MKTFISSAIGGSTGAILYYSIGGIGVAVVGTGIGLGLGTFICTGAAVGYLAPRVYRSFKDPGNNGPES